MKIKPINLSAALLIFGFTANAQLSFDLMQFSTDLDEYISKSGNKSATDAAGDFIGYYTANRLNNAQKSQALKQGRLSLHGQIKHTLIKGQPAQFAVKVAVDGELIGICRGGEVEVVVDVATDLVNIAPTVGIHVHILARERIARSRKRLRAGERPNL
jgi:hypothetical protein